MMEEEIKKETSKKPESEKGIIKDIYDHIKERMSGSFLPAFIISFIVVNWQFFYITFFVSEQYIYKMKVNGLSINKIQYIYYMYDRLCGRDYYGWYLIGGPLLGVVLYYFAIPFFDELIKIIKYQLSTDYFPNKIKGWFRGKEYITLVKDPKYDTSLSGSIILEKLYEIINNGNIFHKQILNNSRQLLPLFNISYLGAMKSMGLIDIGTANKMFYFGNNYNTGCYLDTITISLTMKGNYYIDRRTRENLAGEDFREQFIE